MEKQPSAGTIAQARQFGEESARRKGTHKNPLDDWKMHELWDEETAPVDEPYNLPLYKAWMEGYSTTMKTLVECEQCGDKVPPYESTFNHGICDQCYIRYCATDGEVRKLAAALRVPAAGKPIPFTADMVLATKNNTKTLTRRVMAAPPPADAEYCGLTGTQGKFRVGGNYLFIKPKYFPGDIVWVQETWRVIATSENELTMDVRFRADGEVVRGIQFSPERFKLFAKYARKVGWQSPYSMPEEAARIRLRIENARAEHVQDITEMDAKAEGVDIKEAEKTTSYAYRYELLWNRMNKRHGHDWNSNSWVWSYRYCKHNEPSGQIN